MAKGGGGSLLDALAAMQCCSKEDSDAHRMLPKSAWGQGGRPVQKAPPMAHATRKDRRGIPVFNGDNEYMVRPTWNSALPQARSQTAATRRLNESPAHESSPTPSAQSPPGRRKYPEVPSPEEGRGEGGRSLSSGGPSKGQFVPETIKGGEEGESPLDGVSRFFHSITSFLSGHTAEGGGGGQHPPAMQRSGSCDSAIGGAPPSRIWSAGHFTGQVMDEADGEERGGVSMLKTTSHDREDAEVFSPVEGKVTDDDEIEDGKQWQPDMQATREAVFQKLLHKEKAVQVCFRCGELNGKKDDMCLGCRQPLLAHQKHLDEELKRYTGKAPRRDLLPEMTRERVEKYRVTKETKFLLDDPHTVKGF